MTAIEQAAREYAKFEPSGFNARIAHDALVRAIKEADELEKSPAENTKVKIKPEGQTKVECQATSGYSYWWPPY